MNQNTPQNAPRIFAALSPSSGVLMFAGHSGNLSDAISAYVRDVSAGSPSIATGLTWYELYGDVEIDTWESNLSDLQWEHWSAAFPTKIPDSYIVDVVESLKSQEAEQ